VLIQSVVTYRRVAELNEQIKAEHAAETAGDGTDEEDEDDGGQINDDEHAPLLEEGHKAPPKASPQQQQQQQAAMLALAAGPPMPVAAGISLIQRTQLFELSESTLREQIGSSAACAAPFDELVHCVPDVSHVLNAIQQTRSSSS
jgi:adenylosuccinate lyase